MPTPPKTAFFHEKIAQKSADGCWLWIGSIQSRGYGDVFNKSFGGHVLAHRVAWMLYRGHIPDGQCVLHKCDVRRCVNPDHLFLGTISDNQADMVSKERQAKGERNGHARLSETDVVAIRRAHERGISQRLIADEHCISRPAVSDIVRRKRWRHVA